MVPYPCLALEAGKGDEKHRPPRSRTRDRNGREDVSPSGQRRRFWAVGTVIVENAWTTRQYHEISFGRLVTLNEPNVVFAPGQVDLTSRPTAREADNSGQPGCRLPVSPGSTRRSAGPYSWPLELVKPITLEEQQPTEVGELENVPTARRDCRFRM